MHAARSCIQRCGYCRIADTGMMKCVERFLYCHGTVRPAMGNVIGVRQVLSFSRCSGLVVVFITVRSFDNSSTSFVEIVF